MPRLLEPVTYEEFQMIVRNLRFRSMKKRELVIGLGDNLCLRVYRETQRLVFYFRGKGCESMLKLGVYPTELDYDDARALADKKNRRYKVAIPCFKTVANEYLEMKRSLVRFPNIRKCVQYLAPLNTKPVTSIRNTDVKNCLLSNKDITPYKIQECIDVFCCIMDLAVENDLLAFHHFRVLKKSEAFPKYVPTEGYRYVLHEDLESVFRPLLAPDPMFLACFLMQLLTCLRPGENRQLKFSYFDFNKKMISVPGNLMKIKKPYPFRIPLTDQMIKIYNFVSKFDTKRANDNDFLFVSKSGRTCLSEPDLSCTLKIVTGGIAQPHGFRKTARSWMADNQISYELACKCLDHELQMGVDERYQKSDLFNPRIEVMKRWNNAVEEKLKFAFDKLEQILADQEKAKKK